MVIDDSRRHPPDVYVSTRTDGLVYILSIVSPSNSRLPIEGISLLGQFVVNYALLVGGNWELVIALFLCNYTPLAGNNVHLLLLPDNEL